MKIISPGTYREPYAFLWSTSCKLVDYLKNKHNKIIIKNKINITIRYLYPLSWMALFSPLPPKLAESIE